MQLSASDAAADSLSCTELSKRRAGDSACGLLSQRHIQGRSKGALWICAGSGRVAVLSDVRAPAGCCPNGELQGRLLRHLPRIGRKRERLIEPRLQIAMGEQAHAQQRDQV
jgi:hypothetical protein